jgi:hypothetical protein
MSRRRGLGVVEILIGAGLGSIVLYALISFLVSTSRAEMRTDGAVEALEHVSNLRSWLARDLDRVVFHVTHAPVHVRAVRAGGVVHPGAEIEFRVLPEFEGDEPVVVRYRYQPSYHRVRRLVRGEKVRDFPLGERGGARFYLAASRLASPGDQIRIVLTAGERSAVEVPPVTVRETIPLAVATSRLAVPYWNRRGF